MSALFGVRKEGRVLHMKRVESALGENSGILFVRRGFAGHRREDQT
jgi:hypothetical protein